MDAFELVGVVLGIIVWSILLYFIVLTAVTAANRDVVDGLRTTNQLLSAQTNLTAQLARKLDGNDTEASAPLS